MLSAAAFRLWVGSRWRVGESNLHPRTDPQPGLSAGPVSALVGLILAPSPGVTGIQRPELLASQVLATFTTRESLFI